MNYDVRLFYSINHWAHPNWLNSAAIIIHYLTRGGLIYIPLLIALTLSRQRDNKSLAKVLAVSGAITYILIDLILKNVFSRARPFLTLPNVYLIHPLPVTFSFPSGQTAMAAMVATVMLLMKPRSWASFAAVLFAVIVSLDRIYMGHHYPTDVGAGLVIGAAIGLTVFLIAARLPGKAGRMGN